ncbi:unnamed protein product, partial [marine sediment metagenome]
NNDMERMGDHAVNIAGSVAFLIEQPRIKPVSNIWSMASEVKEMLKDSVEENTEVGIPKEEPAVNITAAVSPIARPMPRMTPVRIPGNDVGKTTFQIVSSLPPPNE